MWRGVGLFCTATLVLACVLMFWAPSAPPTPVSGRLKTGTVYFDVGWSTLLAIAALLAAAVWILLRASRRPPGD